MAAVLEVLGPVASFDVLDDVGLEELLEQLQGLIAGHLGPEVVVAPQQLVQVIHSLGPGETPVVAAEVSPVPLQWHAAAEQLNGFIPL